VHQRVHGHGVAGTDLGRLCAEREDLGLVVDELAGGAEVIPAVHAEDEGNGDYNIYYNKTKAEH
jgi:hypothetical protein